MARPQLIEEVMALEPDERAKLAELLWNSLEDEADDAKVDRLWLEEAKRRIDDYRAGKTKALTTEEFFRGMKPS